MTTKLANLPDWIYRQSAVLPYRREADEVQVLLVTSRKGKRWVLPKGIVEPGLTAAESAAKEAQEEAGVQGTVTKDSLGKYRYKKWGGTCRVEVYPMEVTGEVNDWPESETRKREWMSLADAAKRIDQKDLKKILRRLPEELNSDGTDEAPAPAKRTRRRAPAAPKPPKLIYLFRHAKSSWKDAELADFDRPLAPRGMRASATMRDYLRLADVEPQLVLCSSAVRTRQTLEEVLSSLGEDVDVKFDRRMYMLGAQGLMNRVRRVPESVRSVMLIGHNPGIQALAHSLVGGGDEEAVGRLEAKFPTGALATLIVPEGKWADLAAGSCELHSFVAPRDLK